MKRFLTPLLALLLISGAAWGTSQTIIGSFVAPLAQTLGGTGCTNLTNCGVAPHVASLTALQALFTANYPNGVWRDDYATGNGAPPQWFVAESGSCAANSRVNDGGSCVNTTSGNSFYFPGTQADLREWGLPTSGDASTQFLAAWKWASGVKGTLFMPPLAYSVAQSSTLDLSAYPNVVLQGADSSYGYDPNPATAAYTLLINTGYGASATGYTINLPSYSTLRGIRVTPSNFVMPNSLRTAITAASNFVGTALTLGSQKDINLEYVMVNAFTTAISSGGDRVHLDHVAGDDTNFWNVTGCGDTCTSNQVEAWPFTATPYNVSPQNQSSAISAFSSGPGGVVEVALTGVPATVHVTGDTVVIGNTTAVYQAPNGRYTITAIDSQHFTLNGSVYATACPSGCGATNEIAYLTESIRKGTAFAFANTGIINYGLVEYGHDTALVYGSGTDGMQCVGCWMDADTAGGTFADNVPIGLINGAAPGNGAVVATHNAFVGGKMYDKATSIYQNATGQPLFVTNVGSIGATGISANVTGAGITVFSGSVYVSNSQVEAPVAGASMAVYTGATKLHLDGVLAAGTIFEQTSAECAKVVNNGAVGPCAWTPTLNTGGTVTHSAGYPQATYIENSGIATVSYADILTGNSGATGGGATVTGLPVAPYSTSSTSSYGCSTGQTGGITFSGGATQLYGTVNSNASQINLDELASGSGSLGLPGTAIGAAAQLSFTCTYPTGAVP